MTVCDSKLCCGCGQCAFVCPRDAITMESDSEGFLRPVINEDKCVSCGLCEKKCPVNSKATGEVQACFAAYSKDADIRKNSSSGGIFAHLARAVVKGGGAVCGAAFDEDMRVVHTFAQTEEEIEPLMRSKYVQSDASGAYTKIKELLSQRRKVLFCGTPCQCAAVRNVFGCDECLILCDFICHGVPTPLLWDKYLNQNYENVKNASFRDKTHGWEEFSMRVESDKGVYVGSLYKDPYIRMFLTNVALRPSCYSCSWKHPNFSSDITLSDFWGVSKIEPAWNDNKGISVVLLRTEAAKELFSLIKDELVFFETDKRLPLQSNGMYVKSSAMPQNREEFFEKLSFDTPFSQLQEQYGRPLPSAEILKRRTKVMAKIMLGKIYRIKKKK